MAPSRRSGWALTSARRVVPSATAISSVIAEAVSPRSARYDGSCSAGSGVPSTSQMRRRMMRSAGCSPAGMSPRRLRPWPFVYSRAPSAPMMKMPSLIRSTRVRSSAACSVASRSSWRAPVTSWKTETLPVSRPSASRSGTVLTRKMAGRPSSSSVSSAPITASPCASARRIGCSAGANRPPSGVRAGSRSRRSLTGWPTSRAAQDEVPVGDQPVGEEGQRHRAAVGDVDGDVGEALARPEQRHRRRAVLRSREEDGRADGGDQHLIERAAEHADELTEKSEDHVPRFVEDEVDQVQEVQDRARRHRDAVGEDEDREETERHEPDEPTDDFSGHGTPFIRRYDTRDVSATRAGSSTARNPAIPRGRRLGIALASSARAVAKQILVVDDQPYLRDVEVLILKGAGYAATALGTASDALARLADIRPDLILLDLSMPGMSGRQFIKRLRAHDEWQGLPVILSSGFLAEDADAALEPGVELLPKPFSDTALLNRVRLLIGPA